MKFIDIHTHNFSLQENTIKIINVFPLTNPFPAMQNGQIFSSGIHPWFINNYDTKELLQKIEHLLKTEKIKAIGECGLDALKGADSKLQKEIFKQHIFLSEKYKCPLIIHCVKKYNEILFFKKQTKSKTPWIIHGFNSSVQMMQQMVDAGIYLSFGSFLLKNIPKTKQLVAEIPAKYLFLETDESNINIIELYDKTANLKSMDLKDLKKQLYNNFLKIFS